MITHNIEDITCDEHMDDYLKNYLTGLQYVHCLGYAFKTFEATSGVPQRSVLGSLNFYLYMNDIGNKLRVHCLTFLHR